MMGGKDQTFTSFGQTPMRLAVISDIHGNLEAFNQVLKDIAKAHIDSVICLGDCVGYGPEPEEVVREIRGRGIPFILGNHELGLVDPGYLDWFNPPTRASLRITRKLLSIDSINYLRTLKPFLTAYGCRFVHGFPPDSITTYLYEVPDPEILRIATILRERICFIGHTHDLHLIAAEGEKVSCLPFRRGTFPLRRDVKYLINVGSVGQPRDGNNQSKYVIWDDEQETIQLRYITYNIAKTAEKILGLDFPEYNARRLF